MTPSLSHRATFVVCILTTLLLTSCAAYHPTDDSLIEIFQTKRDKFNQLLEMIRKDKDLTRVSYNFTRPGDPATIGVTPERLKEYRNLFADLNLAAGIEASGGKDSVYFHSSTQGLSVSGSSKGFVYLEKAPAVTLHKLDGYRSPDGKSFSVFRHLEGNWYLYYEFED